MHDPHIGYTVGKIVFNENRAPTDESVRIYKELSEAAQKSIIDLIKVENNEFNFVVWTQESFTDSLKKIRVKFSLNNKEHIIDYEFSTLFQQPTMETIARTLHSLIVDVVAKQIVIGVLPKLK